MNLRSKIINPINSRRFVRMLRGYQGESDNQTVFSDQKRAYENASMIVRYYYIIMFFFTINLYFFNWEDWKHLEGLTQPLWPVRWLDFVPFLPSLNTLIVIAILITFLVALFPNNRALRILGFLFVLQSFAIPNSFGKINHSMHLWVAAGFFFIFLPSGEINSITKRHQYLTAFFSTQVLIFLFYTSSGIWKTAGGVIQMFLGEVHAFHPLGLSHHVANRLVQTNFESIFGVYIIEYAYVGWVLFVGAIFLEVFSIVAVFRPNLHRLWGISLISLHIGIWLTLHVPFVPNILFLMIFFVNSPFHPDKLTLKDIVFSLPIIGDLAKAFPQKFGKRSMGVPLPEGVSDIY